MNAKKLTTFISLALVALVTAFGPASALAQYASPHYFGPMPNWAYSPLPKGSITTITVVDGGTGYVSPVILISDAYGPGTGAVAAATVAAGVITGITVSNGGTGYVAPVITIVDSAGTGALAEASIVGSAVTGGLRKFVDTLPGLGSANPGSFGKYIPVAVADTTTYPGSDYFEIAVVEYSERMHSDLPATGTRLRGYVQIETPVIAAIPGASAHYPLTYISGAPILDTAGNQVYAVDRPRYLGPIITALKDRPTRLKVNNYLPVGTAGDLFIPVDTTVMGAGMGPDGMNNFTQNRAVIHLHGGHSAWISDGTAHQWFTPAGENTPFPKGVSYQNVPDMPDPGPGAVTLYYTNQQSGRLLFYHDHAWGITRLNVYAGEAAGYLISDPTEQNLVNTGIIPADQIPLVIQDKTFVDASTVMKSDPTWRWGTNPGTAVTGDLWLPHVYMTAQNPADITGTNAFGRWHYAAWFWPPVQNLVHPPVPNPYYDPINAPWEPPMNPGVPDNSQAMEAFMDTPVINGMVYPTITVQPKAYRFRILNASNDRFFNLQLHVADPAVVTIDGRTNTEVRMVPASPAGGLPANWPTDGRVGGVPDPLLAGPDWLQIGTESGFLAKPARIPSQPIQWNTDPTTFNFGNVSEHSLLLGCAERADVIVDFSQYAGQTLILYNDAPAAFPALDPRYDYYTGAPNLVDTGGAPGVLAGFGPNTRTIMQIVVSNATPVPFDPVPLESALRSAFATSQEPIIVGQSAYDSTYGVTFPSLYPNDGYVRIQDNSMVVNTVSGASFTMPLQPKAIHDEMGAAFDPEYGRMSTKLGLELPFTQFGRQTFVLQSFIDPPTEILADSMTPMSEPAPGDGTQIWKITHNGVDTHPLHFHLFDVQLINRVGWDGAIRLPDANELGWKETVRISPLEDTIVALRPFSPTMPFNVPDNVRPLNPAMPIGSTYGFANIDVLTGNPLTTPVTNQLTNFGWEYTFHCHILGHEEMDMMRPIVFRGPSIPGAPTNIVATGGPTQATVSFTAPFSGGSSAITGYTVTASPGGATASGLTSPITITGLTAGQYSFTVRATNAIGNGVTSNPSNTVAVGSLQAPSNLAGVMATGPLRVTLTWTNNAGLAATGFRIQRATNATLSSGLTTITVGTVTANPQTYVDTNVQAGVTYYYRVQATRGTTRSNWSSIISVGTGQQVQLLTPTNPAASAAIAPLRVNFTWTNNGTGSTGFRIQRARNASLSLGLTTFTVGTVTANPQTFVDTNVQPGTQYFYRVQATNGTLRSNWSGIVSATTP